MAPIIGPKSVEQLEGNLRALEIDVSEETAARIDKASLPDLPYPQNFQRMMRMQSRQD